MRITNVRVENFRSIRDASFSCDRLTALVGRNGTGKSSFLHAIELFFDHSARLAADDFFASDTSAPVQVSLTFSGLALLPEERQIISPYLSDASLTVIKRFPEPESPGSYHGFRPQHDSFAPIREAGSKSAINAAYRQFRQEVSEEYRSLSTTTSADAVLAELSRWEDANPQACHLALDDGSFFDPAGSGGKFLARTLRFIRVPAVRDARDDATDKRGSCMTEILDLVVRRSLAAHPDVARLNQDIADQSRRILRTAAGGELRGIQERLSSTLGEYAPNAAVTLNWIEPTPPTIPMPTAQVTITEDRYETPVERAGHGVQRAFILTMLQHLTATRDLYSTEPDEPRPANDAEQDPPVAQPTVILAIEEPELYQHPSRQRHLASVLELLTEPSRDGAEQQTQVIYSTHAPLMVGFDRIDHLKLLRKDDTALELPSCTTVAEVTMDAVATQLWELDGRPEPQYSASSLRPRMQVLMTPWMNEGFFADVVVLVEGDGDRAAILSTAEELGERIEAWGICVVPCSGKENLDRPAIVFRSFDIPTYVVWDNDRTTTDHEGAAADSRTLGNKRLLRLMGGREEDWPSGVRTTYACVEGNLEATLRREIGCDVFDEILDNWSSRLSMKAKEAKKRAFVLRKVIRDAAERGCHSQTLEEIVRAILAIHPGHSSH